MANWVSKIDQVLKANAGFSEVAFRISLSLIFVVGGLGHFVQHRQMLDRMAESPWAGAINAMGSPSVLLWLSGIVFVMAGLALAAGFFYPAFISGAFYDADTDHDCHSYRARSRRSLVQEHRDPGRSHSFCFQWIESVWRGRSCEVQIR